MLYKWLNIYDWFQICADRAELDLSSFQSVEEWGQSQSGFLQLSNQANDTDQFPPAEGIFHHLPCRHTTRPPDKRVIRIIQK